MQPTQMNTRIDSTLKAEGDSVLAAFGYTPSQAVRAMWRFLVANRDNPDRIKAALENADADSGQDAELERRLGILEDGHRLYDTLLPQPSGEALLSYDELRDSAYASMLEEMLEGSAL